MQNQWNRRKYPRVPVSFLVHCKQEDGPDVGGKAFNLSTGGIAIETNCPTRIGDELTVELLMPDMHTPVRGKGEVVWSQFHGHTPSEEETLFTAGIKFLDLEEPTRTLISKSIQTLSDS